MGVFIELIFLNVAFEVGVDDEWAAKLLLYLLKSYSGTFWLAVDSLRPVRFTILHVRGQFFGRCKRRKA